jgi:hypothetical protein
MTVRHYLRGYAKDMGHPGIDDPDMGDLVVEFRIDGRRLPDLREILRAAEDDPDLIDPYELAGDLATRLAEVLGVVVDPARLDYFVETEEDWRVVAAIRVARFAEV